MGALQSLSDEPEYRELAEKTGFSFEQIGILHKRFKQLSHNEDMLRRADLDTIPDLACNPIRTQIIEAFFDKRNFHQNGDGTVEEISFEEFLVVMSHFRPPALNMTEEQREKVRREKLRFLFNMHDTDNDGTITLEEYRHCTVGSGGAAVSKRSPGKGNGKRNSRCCHAGGGQYFHGSHGTR
ncbi:tescalcin b isoform X2 [Oncorhynchus masou masou]|uniref:tescalcin b isoform X2 n=1 Tax=Oncorhynchus masou masou TaxID=90313 RepID=UPI003184464F